MRPVTCDCGSCRKCKQRAYMRVWYASHPGYAADAVRRRRTVSGDALRQYAREQYRRRMEDPELHEKMLARIAVSNAVRRGKIVRPDVCSECGDVAAVHAHHSDYTKRLDVAWLCTKCHGARHRGP